MAPDQRIRRVCSRPPDRARVWSGVMENTDTQSAQQGPALMAAAAAETARVIGGVPDGTAAMEAPTPCTDWDLRTLLNHVILWTSYSAHRRAPAEGSPPHRVTNDLTPNPACT